jgi:hypothetical protein
MLTCKVINNYSSLMWYLGITPNSQNNMHKEINMKLNATYHCFYARVNLFKLKLLSEKLKSHIL